MARLAIALAVLLCASSSGARAQDAPLRLCADPANLPFSTESEAAANAGAPGLHVEIGRLIARALGRPMRTVWSQSYFGKRNLRDTLLAGKCDFAVGLPAAGDFMAPAVIVSRPILSLGYAIAAAKGVAIDRLADLDGKRVAVQFGSPPQSLLATRDAIASVTVLDPDEAMRLLGDRRVDVAFVWGPSAGYANRVLLRDAYVVRPVDAPQMRYAAAIGFSRTSGTLRDAVDAALPALAPDIAALARKYGLPDIPPVSLAATETPITTQAVKVASDAAVTAADAIKGRETFNGTCAHCHGPDAIQSERRINLRLLRHRYGDDMHQVFSTTVHKGRPVKGMPAWAGVFSDADIEDIYAYLATIQDH